MRRPVGVFVGLAGLDVVHHAARRPGPDEKITAERQFVAAGGPATNAAVTFAALGGRAHLVTALGAGPVARLVREELQERGIPITDCIRDAGSSPPVAAILVDPVAGTRSVVSPDAAQLTTVAPDLRPLLAAADVVLVDGHHAPLAAAAARAAGSAGLPLVVDAGRWKPAFDDVLPHATAVICSADFPLGGPELVARGVPLAAVTHGPEPVGWWTAEGSGVVEVPPVEAVDTLGAGDVFHGAYAYFCLTHDPVPSLRLAVRVAGLSVVSAGPRAWLTALPPASDGRA